jgi:hypothetical protein
LKKFHFVVLIATTVLTACLPAFLQPSADPAQQPDVAATIAAGLTAAAQTLESQATPTLVPSATRTATASATHTPTATHSAVPTASETPTGTVFATLTTGTAVTATNVTGTPSTPIQPTSPSGSPTPTLYPRFFGTLPPAIPSGKLTIINRSKSEVYISLRVVTSDGQISILEYPVPRRLEFRAPAGKYTYVAWVGGNKMSGQFSLGKSGERTITIYKDRIGIK